MKDSEERADNNKSTKEVRLFVSSSVTEFAQERADLNSFLGRLNSAYKDRGIRFVWNATEDLTLKLSLNASSSNSLKQQIRDSNYFLLIIGEKLGANTEQEFNVAVEEFQRKGTPLILTYFLLPTGTFPSAEVVAFRELLKNKYQQFTEVFPNMDAIKVSLQLELIQGVSAITKSDKPLREGDNQSEVAPDEKALLTSQILKSVNIQPPLIQYEGKEPYIFISYSRQDDDVVMDILRAMVKDGYRIWFDEGIPLTMEWPDEIALHLINCSICIAFHSTSSVKSKHCKAELHYAIKKDRHLLSVYLEDDVSLSPGLEMYLSPGCTYFFGVYNNIRL